MNRDSEVSPFIIKKIITAFSVLFLPVFLGMQIGKNPVLGAAYAGAFGLLIMLFMRPPWFLMLGIFVFYGALNIVDTEIFGRVHGFFRLKDLFFVVIIGYTVASEIIKWKEPKPQQSSIVFTRHIFIPWILFLLWLGWQMFYTVKILGEAPVLAFRAGRHFLAYTFPFFIVYWLKTDRDWKHFLIFLHCLAGLTIFLSILTALGIDITLIGYEGRKLTGSFYEGVYKFYNPGESLVYCMFMFNLWRFSYQPSKKNLFLLIFLGLGCGMFIFRARIIGLVLGLLAGLFFAHGHARRRAVASGSLFLILLALFLTVFGIFVSSRGHFLYTRAHYIAKLFDYFEEAIEGVISQDSDAIRLRQRIAQTRLPLIKEHFISGIGFISPFGMIGWQLYRYGEMPGGHVDTGWIDVLIRLGPVGAALLAALLIYSAIQGRHILRQHKLAPEGYAFGLAIIGFVVQMFVSAYSFSYPTLESGIMTFAILLSWVLRYSQAEQVPASAERDEHKWTIDSCKSNVR